MCFKMGTSVSSRICRSAHKVRFCFQYAKFETSASQGVEESFNEVELTGSIRLEIKFGSNQCIVGI